MERIPTAADTYSRAGFVRLFSKAGNREFAVLELICQLHGLGADRPRVAARASSDEGVTYSDVGCQ